MGVPAARAPRQPHTTMWHNISRFPDAKPVRGIAVVQFDSRLYFANASVFQVRLVVAPCDGTVGLG